MENQTMLNIGMIVLMLAGFATISVIDPDGVEMEPTHYCNSIGRKMYCARVTAYYCFPSNSTRMGSKKCNEGWKKIPFLKEISTQTTTHSSTERCTPKCCEFLNGAGKLMEMDEDFVTLPTKELTGLLEGKSE